MSRPISIQIPHMKLQALHFNEGAGDRIIALHGWLDNLNSMVPLIEHLPGREIVAVDLPGHGQSDHRPEGSIYHFIDTVFDTVALADELGWKTFKIIGHSMGAGIAALVAGTVANRVESIVCLEGFGPLSHKPDITVERLQTHMRQVKRLPMKKFPIYKCFEDALSARKLAGDLSDDAAKLLVERGTKAFHGGITWSSDARLRVKSAHPFVEEQIHAFIKEITSPVFVLRANPGFPFDEAQLNERLRLVKKLSYHKIMGHHHVHMDEASKVAELIEQFWQEHHS